MGQRLDIYDKFPPGMQQYLGCYGWHFSKRMAQFAISRMKVKDDSTGKEKSLVPWTKSEVDEMLKRNGITVEHDELYDVCYVANMLKADFYKKSLADEAHLCVHVKLYSTILTATRAVRSMNSTPPASARGFLSPGRTCWRKEKKKGHDSTRILHTGL